MNAWVLDGFLSYFCVVSNSQATFEENFYTFESSCNARNYRKIKWFYSHHRLWNYFFFQMFRRLCWQNWPICMLKTAISKQDSVCQQDIYKTWPVGDFLMLANVLLYIRETWYSELGICGYLKLLYTEQNYFLHVQWIRLVSWARK